MRQSSYFRRVAGVVDGQPLQPARSLYASFPSVPSPATIMETTQGDTIRPPAVHSKIRPVTAAGEGPPQPQSAQTLSPRTTSSTSLQTQIAPVESHLAPALKSAPRPVPVQSIQQRQFVSQIAEASRMPKPIGPPPKATVIDPTLADAVAPTILSGIRPSARPTTSDSVQRPSVEAPPARDMAEKASVAAPDVRKPASESWKFPIRLQPPAPGQAESTAPFADAGGAKIHIGSLEIKITPPPTQPPPSQAASPVRKAPAVQAKSISREFATFGLAQGY